MLIFSLSYLCLLSLPLSSQKHQYDFEEKGLLYKERETIGICCSDI